MKGKLKTILIGILVGVIGWGSVVLVSRTFSSPKETEKEETKTEQSGTIEEEKKEPIKSDALLLQPYDDNREMVAYIKLDKNSIAFKSTANLQGGTFNGITFMNTTSNIHTTCFTLYCGYRSTDTSSINYMNVYCGGSGFYYLTETVYLPISQSFVDKLELTFDENGETTMLFNTTDWELTSEIMNMEAEKAGSKDPMETYEWTATFATDYTATVYNYIPGA